MSNDIAKRMAELRKWNNEELKPLRDSGISDAVVRPISVVRSLGDLKSAKLWDGTVVTRKDKIWVDAYGTFVKCMPYELHFIYEVPKEHRGWGLMCTCGSIAGVSGAKAYKKLITPSDTGLMIVCVRHSSTKDNTGVGNHADGSHE